MGKIPITNTIEIQENELKFDFIRSSGPGGQNVNKVATAVQLRYDVINSPSLPDDVRERVLKLAKNRINENGILIIEAKRYRTQNKNRQDAIDRLAALIVKAMVPPRKRIETKPSVISKQRRLAEKKHRSEVKRLRKPPSI